MTAQPMNRSGLILLAAGASSRMGRPKMLLPWGTTTVLGHLIDVWKELGATQIAVVCASHDAGLAAELDRVRFPADDRILNPDPARGMFSSIQCAAHWDGWRPDLTHWILALGDQPHLQPATLRALLDFAAEHPGNICQPSSRGRPRHPVFLPKTVFGKLRDSQDETLRQFLHGMSANVRLLEIDDPGLDVDLDHPADYETARALRVER
jgi:molybdenum cofactor cytidylyltransferase